MCQEVLPRCIDRVNLDGESHPGNKQAERRKLGSRGGGGGGWVQHREGPARWEAHLAVAISTSLQNCRPHAGNRPPVIGGPLLVGIMNSVVSAEVIGRALLQ